MPDSARPVFASMNTLRELADDSFRRDATLVRQCNFSQQK